jgi:hypothetical protein
MNVLCVEDSVCGVKSCLVLCGITNQSFLVGEGNERRSNTVTLLVGDCGERLLLVRLAHIWTKSSPEFVVIAEECRWEGFTN